MDQEAIDLLYPARDQPVKVSVLPFETKLFFGPLERGKPIRYITPGKNRSSIKKTNCNYYLRSESINTFPYRLPESFGLMVIFAGLGVIVTSKKKRLNMLLDSGDQNPVAKLLVSVLSTLAEIDYNNRREAQREGIERAKAEGKYKGRANGTGLSDFDLVEKHSDIVEELNRGESIRRTAKLTEKSKSTVQRVKKVMDRIEID